MLCGRCKGLMVPDHYYDLLEARGPLHIEAWRCICCGNILDPLILRNRQAGERLKLICDVTAERMGER